MMGRNWFRSAIRLILVALFLWASVGIVDRAYFFLRSEITTGVRMGFRMLEEEGERRQIELIEYEVDGQVYPFHNEHPSSFAIYDISKPVPVLYLRSDPSRARLYESHSYWADYLICMLASGMVLAFMTVLYRRKP